MFEANRKPEKNINIEIYPRHEAWLRQGDSRAGRRGQTEEAEARLQTAAQPLDCSCSRPVQPPQPPTATTG